MALETVTGSVSDFGDNGISNLPGVRLWFEPTGNAIGGSTLFATEKVYATIESDGDWSVQLQSTEALSGVAGGRVWYKPVLQWLDSAGNFVKVDYIDWQLEVPVGGGDFTGLVIAPSNPAQTWISLSPPLNPTPGTWWLKTNPDNPSDPLNTGNLYQWEA